MTKDRPLYPERSANTLLTPEEKMEVTKLYLRLYRLYPDLNYLRDTIHGSPPAGRGELPILRGEVDYEEHCEAERLIRYYGVSE